MALVYEHNQILSTNWDELDPFHHTSSWDVCQSGSLVSVSPHLFDLRTVDCGCLNASCCDQSCWLAGHQMSGTTPQQSSTPFMPRVMAMSADNCCSSADAFSVRFRKTLRDDAQIAKHHLIICVGLFNDDCRMQSTIHQLIFLMRVARK